ncbi:MAG: phosphotransferase, partial [Micropruina sp.]
MAGIPVADIEIDAGLVRSLLTEQCRWLAAEPLELFANGWDNVSFHVGEVLLARLPRRAMAAPLIEHEQDWLPLLAELVPAPVPVPIFAGRPSALYPYPWSVVPLLPGRMLAEASLAERRVIAPSLARVFEGLHVPADRDA